MEFALSKDIAAILEEEAPVNDRIMIMRLLLQKKLYVTFISACICSNNDPP